MVNHSDVILKGKRCNSETYRGKRCNSKIIGAKDVNSRQFWTVRNTAANTSKSPNLTAVFTVKLV